MPHMQIHFNNYLTNIFTADVLGHFLHGHKIRSYVVFTGQIYIYIQYMIHHNKNHDRIAAIQVGGLPFTIVYTVSVWVLNESHLIGI